MYVSVLMDVFTRVVRGWQLSQHLNHSLTLKPLEQAFHQSVVEIHHSDQGEQYLSSAYLLTLRQHSVDFLSPERAALGERGC